MNNRCRPRITLAACALALGVTMAPQHAESSTETKAVKALLAAFNDHSPERMAELVSADFELYYITNGESALGLKGPEALRKEMTGYFASLPTVRSKAKVAQVSGSYVACKETVSWEHEGVTRSQFSLAVYEVRDGKIRRTWYYPAER